MYFYNLAHPKTASVPGVMRKIIVPGAAAALGIYLGDKMYKTEADKEKTELESATQPVKALPQYEPPMQITPPKKVKA